MEQKEKLIIYDMRKEITIKKVILQIASTPY